MLINLDKSIRYTLPGYPQIRKHIETIKKIFFNYNKHSEPPLISMYKPIKLNQMHILSTLL